MKFTHLLLLSIGLFLLCSCTFFYGTQSDSDPVVLSPKPLAVPVGNNWQITEEAPKLGDGTRLPFQTEQSVQPEGAKPVSPAGNRTIETSH